MNPKRDLIKTMAAIAAAATMLAGMAFGAATANAAETTPAADTVADALTDTQIKITASSADQFKTDNNGGIRQFKYAKLAGYNFDTTTNKPYLTTTDTKNKQTIIKAMKDAGLAPDENMDPFTWLGSQSVTTITDAKWRKFVENTDLQNLATHDVTPTVSTDGKTLTFDFNNTDLKLGGRGLYLILDKSGDYAAGVGEGCTVTYHRMKAILIGTRLKDAEKELSTGSLTIADAVWGNIAPDAAVEVKSTKDEVCKPHPGFTKVGDDGSTGLQGAVFSVYKANQGATDEEFKDGVLAGQIDSNKFVEYNQFGTTDPKTNTLTSDKDGKVDFGVLPAGTYYVYESTMPTVAGDSGKQYLTDYRAVLKVTVEEGIQGNPGSFTIEDLNKHDLLTGDATKGYTYKNVTSIIHLPLTGAAGTALFVAVAVLLAGAAGVTFVRSRMVKRALR